MKNCKAPPLNFQNQTNTQVPFFVTLTQRSYSRRTPSGCENVILCQQNKEVTSAIRNGA